MHNVYVFNVYARNWSWRKMRKLITQLIRRYKPSRSIFLVFRDNDTIRRCIRNTLYLKYVLYISYIIRVGAASFMNMTVKDSFRVDEKS